MHNNKKLLNPLDHALNGESISPKVATPIRKKEIYKSTLVSVLNQDPHLSHDRYYFHFYSSWTSRSVEVALI